MAFKKETIWITVSPSLHQKIKEEARKMRIPASKYILYIAQNFTGQIKEDLTYSSASRKKFAVQVTEARKKEIEQLAKQHKMTVAAFFRNMLYTVLNGE